MGLARRMAWMGRLGMGQGLARPLARQRPLQLPPALGAARLALRPRLVLARLRGPGMGGMGLARLEGLLLLA